MPTNLAILGIGALLGWTKSRTKKGRLMNAVLWSVGASVVASQVLPRVGVRLPARIG